MQNRSLARSSTRDHGVHLRIEVAVCNLASIALPAFVQENGKADNLRGLYKVVKVATRIMNTALAFGAGLWRWPLALAFGAGLGRWPLALVFGAGLWRWQA